MDTLLNALYAYSVEYTVDAYLRRPEYKAAQELRQRHRDALAASLNQEELETLEKYEDARSEEESLTGDALFCAGLSLGLELARL